MNRKRKSVTSEPNSNTKKSSFDNDDENDALNDDITNVLSKADSDVEAAIRYIKKILVTGLKVKTFPPVIFVHQLYDIIHDKSVVNRQVERLRNQKTLVLIHLGTDEWMKIVILFEDLRNHVLQQRELAEKLLYQKFLDKVLMNTTDIGISRSDLLLKFKFSEKDIRALVNTGLLILKETGIFWFSFPSAGIFMKKFLKGRQFLVTMIKKRKSREILQRDLEKISMKKSLELPIKYHVHDLAGGNFVQCFKTTSGRLLRVGL